MQSQKIYSRRKDIHDVLTKMGPMTLSDLEMIMNLPKNKIRYTIESTHPFEALFKKVHMNRICKYEAVPLDDIYGY